ncbi:hypothetical protein ACB092_04G146600 [Castanea dentata]
MTIVAIKRRHIWQRPSQPTNQQQPQIEEEDESKVFGFEFHMLKSIVQEIAGLAGTSRMPIVVDIIYVELMEIEAPIVDLVLDDDTIILDSMETYEPKSIPTTKSSIEALEKIMFQPSPNSIQECSICLEELFNYKHALRFQPSSNSIQECSICLEEFQIGFEVTSMPCSHVYHGKCIAQWLQASHFCPLCRYPMPNNAC